MQVVMQDEYAHICSACGFTWPRKGRDDQYRERYGEPIWPYEAPDPMEDDLKRSPDWCDKCGEDTPTISYNTWKPVAERRCAYCGLPKVLSSES